MVPSVKLVLSSFFIVFLFIASSAFIPLPAETEGISVSPAVPGTVSPAVPGSVSPAVPADPSLPPPVSITRSGTPEINPSAVDRYVASSIPSVPQLLESTTPGTGTRSTHVEPDDSGSSYNNNMSCAELLGPGDTYNSSDGVDAPYLNCSWGPDLENPSYGSWYTGCDIYRLYLHETNTTDNGDLVNITISPDYGTNHSGNLSWKEMGMNIYLYDRDYEMLCQRNLHHSSQNPSSGTYLTDYFSNWRDIHGSWYTSVNLIPSYTGYYYLYLTPSNWTVIYGSGTGMSPYPAETRLWYNISCALTSGITDYPPDCFNTGLDHFYTGETDSYGGSPTFDTDVRMEHAAGLNGSSIPKDVNWVHGLDDMNDWFDHSDMLMDDPNGTIAEDVNVSFELYRDNYLLLNYGGGNTVTIWAMTTFTCWFRNATGDRYYSVSTWGNGALTFWNTQTNSAVKYNRPYLNFRVNRSTDELYTHVSVDMIFIAPSWMGNYGYTVGKVYPSSSLFDYLAPYCYYNISGIMVYQEDPRPPEVLNATVDPGDGLMDADYTYGFTYLDHNGFMPTHLRLVIDQGTASPQFFNILTHGNAFEFDPGDNDTTDGKRYGLLYDLADLAPGNHTFLVEFSDGRAAFLSTELHDGPYIYDNLPPIVKTEGLDPRIYLEDSGMHRIYMDDIFVDPNDHFSELEFAVKGHTGIWGSTYGPNIVRITMDRSEAIVTTVPNASGELNISFRATDPKGEFVIAGIPVVVRPVDDAPVITDLSWSNRVYTVTDHGTDVYAAEGRQLNLSVNVVDPDENEEFAFRLSDTTLTNASGPQVNDSGILYFTPTEDDVGVRTISVYVRDHSGLEDHVIITVHTDNVPDPPVLTVSGNHSVRQYDRLDLVLSAYDPDTSDIITFSTNMTDAFGGLPMDKNKNWGLDQSTGLFWLRPVDQALTGRAPRRVYHVEFVAVDTSGQMDSIDWAVTIINTNDPPTADSGIVATATDLFLEEPGVQNLEWNFSQPGVVDLDGDELVYEWVFGDGTSSRAGMTVIHVFPEEGSYEIALTISDGNGGELNTTITVRVLEHHLPPVDPDDPGWQYPPVNTDGNVTGGEDGRSDRTTLWIALVALAILAIIIAALVVVIVIQARRRDRGERDEVDEMYLDDVEIVAPTTGRTKWWKDSRDADITEEVSRRERRKIVHVERGEMELLGEGDVDPLDIGGGHPEEGPYGDMPVIDITPESVGEVSGRGMVGDDLDDPDRMKDITGIYDGDEPDLDGDEPDLDGDEPDLDGDGSDLDGDEPDLDGDGSGPGDDGEEHTIPPKKKGPRAGKRKNGRRV